MEKSIFDKSPTRQTRDYVIWKIFPPEVMGSLAAASRENGLEPKELGSRQRGMDISVYRLSEGQVREILKGYFLDGDDKDIGRQVGIPEEAWPGILETYRVARSTFAVSVDVPLSVAEFAGNRNAVPNVGVHDRRQAEALIGADALRAYAAQGCNKVNVVIIDGGLDEDYLRSLGYEKALGKLGGSKAFGTGLTRRPGRRHGNAVARNILALAPNVQFHDLNLLPDRINSIDAYTSDLTVPLLALDDRIRATRGSESWVVVCAWGLMDTAYDLDLGTFARSRYHLLSQLFSVLVSGGADVVFSAGNNGLFWPDVFSGVRDRGPGRSIYGTNALEEVLTVGAVDALGLWSGTSSQGPEPRGLRIDPRSPPRKPDVCAPSGFYETGDRHEALNGTSGACAVAAGVVASLRQRIPQTSLPSGKLIAAIRRTARREGLHDGKARETPAEWRLGAGVIDAAALVAELSPRFP